jgi:hypothetical protein
VGLGKRCDSRLFRATQSRMGCPYKLLTYVLSVRATVQWYSGCPSSAASQCRAELCSNNAQANFTLTQALSASVACDDGWTASHPIACLV